MTDQQHPITPPPELLSRWEEDWHYAKVKHIELEDHIATQAARWGADQELEACKQFMYEQDWFMSPTLRVAQLHNARRPKPPSLKEQALEQLDGIATCFRATHMGDIVCDKIRRALEQLDD